MMMIHHYAPARATLLCMTALVTVLIPNLSHAHGRAGNRIFPATLAVEDPAVSDELALPHFHSAEHDGHGGLESDFGIEFSKRLTPHFALGVEAEHTDGHHGSGWTNPTLGATWQAFTNPAHEAVMSFGVDWDVGGVGNKDVSEEFSTFTPKVLFGKGMGDLPGESLKGLRPLAVTGSVGVAIPSEDETLVAHHDGYEREKNHERLVWGLTLQYSIPYLQEFVHGRQPSGFFDKVVPVVEFAMETPLSGSDSGQTTGSVNPGFLWQGRAVQFGVEAVIPVNTATGNQVGVAAHLHFNLDHVFPASLGKPIWE